MKKYDSLIDEFSDYDDFDDDYIENKSENTDKNTISEEFKEFTSEEEIVEQLKTSYIIDSLTYISKAKECMRQETLYGIYTSSISKTLKYSSTDVIPWEHVTMYLDTTKLNDISGQKIREFRVFDFVEELNTIPNTEFGFGFNNSHRNLLESLVIPENVLVINSKTFAFYKKLKSITFEDDCKLLKIGTQAFAYCEKLHTLDLSKCEYLEELSEDMLYGSGVTILKLNTNIKKIPECAFNNSKVKTVIIGDTRYKLSELLDMININNGEPFWYTEDNYIYDF